jgi:2-polyprenyl-6-methoxyphenol hydroxylase-like FAD-dependent oxidoreductase
MLSCTGARASGIAAPATTTAPALLHASRPAAESGHGAATHGLCCRRYVNQPEPELKSYSVTVKADAAKLERMHADARETFSPALAQVMAATPEPWINAIFDREPLRHWAFGRCALVGEAAHPTSPHGLRCAPRAHIAPARESMVCHGRLGWSATL